MTLNPPSLYLEIKKPFVYAGSAIPDLSGKGEPMHVVCSPDPTFSDCKKEPVWIISTVSPPNTPFEGLGLGLNPKIDHLIKKTLR